MLIIGSSLNEGMISTLISAQNYTSKISYELSEKRIIFSIDVDNKDDLFSCLAFIQKNLYNLIPEDYYVRTNINFEIDISSQTFEEEIDFSKCIFKEKVGIYFSAFNEDVSFNYSTFEKGIDFYKTVFESKVRFHSVKFNDISTFNNTTFNDLVDFYHAEFKKPQQFWLTDFLSTTIFSNVIFEDQVQFLYNKVKMDSLISFENAKFKQSLDISRANFWCKLQFWGVEIENTIPTKYNLYSHDETKEIKTKENNFLHKIRESYRIIKFTFKTEGNNIEASNFNQKELQIYKEEIRFIKDYETANLRIVQLLYNALKLIINIVIFIFGVIGNIFGFKTSIISRVEENITITFNYLSNNFGQSWFRAILFTLISTLIFFFTFLHFSKIELYYSSDLDDVFKTLKYYIQFLNLMNWDYSPYGIDIKNKFHLGYVILFVGRIFIGYGYYQTIQAFRKFGKNQ